MTKTSATSFGIGWRHLVLAAGLTATSAAAWGAECDSESYRPFTADDAEDFSSRVRTLYVGTCVAIEPKGIRHPSVDEWCIPGSTYEGVAETIRKILSEKGYEVRTAAVEDGHDKPPEEADAALVHVEMRRTRIDGRYVVYAWSAVRFGHTVVYWCQISDGARAYEDDQRYLYTVRHSLERIPARLVQAGKPAANKPAAPQMSIEDMLKERYLQEYAERTGTSLLLVSEAERYCNSGDVKWGLRAIEIGLAAHPNDDMFLIEARGDCLAKKGDRAAALRDWEIALKMTKDLFSSVPDPDPVPGQSQVELEIKLGRCREALSHLDAIEKYAQSHPATDEHGRGHESGTKAFIARSRKACAGRKNPPE